MSVRKVVQVVLTPIAIIAMVGVLGIIIFLSSRPAGQAGTATIQNTPYEVRVETEPKSLQVGDAATVRLRVLQNGQPIDLNENGRLFHVIIVSADLGDIFHTLAPTREAVGVYRVEHIFTRAGKYRIWTEVDNIVAEQRHDQYAEQIAYAEVSVTGTTTLPVPEMVTEAVVDSYRVQLTTPTVTVGQPTALKVRVLDQTGKEMQLEPHEPFLYAMSGENFSFFRHGHGQTLADGSAGLENTFPTPGRYVWWMELFVQESDKYRSIEVPFILNAS